MFIFDVARLAQKSLVYEASVYPKPGLVTPLDSGAHSDMDYRTFIDSAIALLPCYIDCASVGNEMHMLPPSDVLERLREAGRQGEKEMCRATRGINTHKGAIFLLGLLCAAAGRLRASGEALEATRVAETASSFVKGIVARELHSIGRASRGLAECTAGELAYLLHRIDGARGEAERGFPTALAALEELKNTEFVPFSFRERLAHVLIGIMADNADSNLISRGGIEALEEVRRAAREALVAGGMWTPEGRERIAEMEKSLVVKNLSPGGCADILSCALFLRLLESEEWEEKEGVET
jgi:triphosphoribosyl-dephospho-CoA synthase